MPSVSRLIALCDVRMRKTRLRILDRDTGFTEPGNSTWYSDVLDSTRSVLRALFRLHHNGLVGISHTLAANPWYVVISMMTSIAAGCATSAFQSAVCASLRITKTVPRKRAVVR